MAPQAGHLILVPIEGGAVVPMVEADIMDDPMEGWDIGPFPK